MLELMQHVIEEKNENMVMKIAQGTQVVAPERRDLALEMPILKERANRNARNKDEIEQIILEHRLKEQLTRKKEMEQKIKALQENIEYLSEYKVASADPRANQTFSVANAKNASVATLVPVRSRGIEAKTAA